MTHHYKANLTKLEKYKSSDKFDSCMLTISVGQTVHEAEKFKATLRVVNDNFKKCTIGVCDTLQRHTLAIPTQLEPEGLYSLSRELGDQWISRNIDYCNEYLKIPFKLARWDDWFRAEEYEALRQRIDKLYEEDEGFIEIVDYLANDFNSRLKKRNEQFDFVRGVRLSTEYLLEECAAMCIWYQEGYSVEVYPSVRNKAIEYGFSKLMPGKYGKLLYPAGIAFKQIKSQDDKIASIAIEKILDTIPGHVYWKDVNGTFLGCNKRQAENYGFTNERNIIGKKDSDFLKSEVSKKIQENDRDIINNNLEEIVEEDTYVQQDKKRLKKTFLSHKIPMQDDDGKIIGIVGISIDITEQKKLQQNLLKKTKELTATLEHKREFLNTLSHEIRTPLHVMGAVIEELHKNFSSFSKQELDSFIIVLVENKQRLMKLLTNLLESAKNIQGEKNYIFKQGDLVKTCAESVKEFEKIADISFTYTEKELNILHDEIKIAQVLRNIIDNAVKYGTNKTIKIVLRAEDQDGLVKCEIENTGSLLAEEKDKLFENFYQGARAKELQNGVGLGLPICKEIITQHKGRIWIDSDNEKTKVSFTLPYRE